MKKTVLKNISALGLAAVITTALIAGCSAKDGSSGQKSGNAAKGKVYFLNYKPEQDKAWQELAKKYTKETGIDVSVVTASQGTYELTLTYEMNRDEAPTLFQVNGPVGLAKWNDFCMDLKNTDIYKQLKSEDFTLKNNNGDVKGIAYVIESYGIIYNKKLLKKYCSSDFASIKKIDDINSFERLKTAADEIQKNKAKLGVKGAFTSAGLDASSEWRFTTHLSNLPIYYEYQKDNISDTSAIKGTYLENYKNIWDLYITDSTCKKKELDLKTESNAEAEFINGEAVFFQNGSWEYDALIKGGFKDDELGMLPIYIDTGNEAEQGLCTGTENYWCINNNASADDKAATEDFINWCVTSDTGTKTMADEMSFEIPFKKAKKSSNIFIKIDNELAKAGKKRVNWSFTTIPSEDWKDGIRITLTQYVASKNNWDAVKKAFVEGWKTEKAKLN